VINQPCQSCICDNDEDKSRSCKNNKGKIFISKEIFLLEFIYILAYKIEISIVLVNCNALGKKLKMKKVHIEIRS